MATLGGQVAMKYNNCFQFFLSITIKNNYLSFIDKYNYQREFSCQIERNNKACKQINQSAYVLFLLLNHLFQRYSTIYATNPLFLSGQSVKGDRDTSSLPFTARKGVRNYETIYFSNYYRKSI